VRGMSAHRDFEKLVVFRIAASRNSHINLNPFSLARQSRQKISNIFLIYVSEEFSPAENFIEFGERRKGKQDSSFLDSQFKCMTRLRIGEEQRTN